MKSPVLALLAILFGASLAGCATTPSGDAMALSGVRIATVAYVVTGKTPTIQQARAAQLVDVATAVKGYLVSPEPGATLATVSAFAVQAINARADMIASDKLIAQAVLIEVLAAVEPTATIPLDADVAARLAVALNEVARTARLYGVVST